MTPTLHDNAAQYLAASDPDWQTLIHHVGPYDPKLKPEREPYEALIRAIAHQQLHGKAAEAILARFTALYPHTPFPSPADIDVTEDTQLRACGFSFSKIAAIRGIVTATSDGAIPSLQEAKILSDEELIKRLITLKGIGRWTVEMFLMFTLARPDILPVDDFGVREGWRLMKSLPEQPKPKALAAIGEAWSPYRSTAAWYLWRAVEFYKARSVENPKLRLINNDS